MVRRDRLARFGVLVGYLSLAVAFSWPLPMQIGTALTGDPGGDTGVYVWNQWVFQHEALVNRHNPLRTEQILSLTPAVDLSQHNYTPFLDVLALPLIQVLGVVAAFNVVFLLSTLLTALATYGLARYGLGAGRVAAWIAGAAFAWSPVLVARSTGHFSLVAAAPLPAFLLCLITANRTRQLRYAVLAGVCVAWAAFCDPYYAVYCLLITAGYFLFHAVTVSRGEQPVSRGWRWTIDVLIVLASGVVAAIVWSGGGRLQIAGLTVSMRGLYTPVFVLTVLALVRLALAFRPIVQFHLIPSASLVRMVAGGVASCAILLAPVLYGLAVRIVEGRFVSPQILWRSSPRGADLLALFAPNPNNALVRAFDDQLTASPTAFVEFTAALSLVALAVIVVARLRAGYRPEAVWIWMTIGAAALALGPFIYVAGINTHVPGPWSILRYVPVVGMARMPTRFAVLAALGLAMLLAGAITALGHRFPRYRAAIAALIAAALLAELSPAPRQLYSARMPSIYEIIAADPRPIRIVELPFGVRDGVSGVGNLSSRYQFYQTRHGKPIMGGYLSRISPRRVTEIRSQPTLDALLTLSEGGTLSPEHEARILARGPGFIRRARIGYVVINHVRAPASLLRFATKAWGLEEVAREWPKVLYRPAVGQQQAAR